ncbi:MAG: FMN-binding protein [Eubacterium sp.]|nr:FMN-binding protein [Eubacterium sp.]MDE6413421.1 FMN-binding protein [Eubacterium sp.]
MRKQAHFKKNSLTWLISLAVMVVLSAAVIVGCVVLDYIQNGKYRNPVEISFTIADTKEIDISSTNAGDYNVTEVKEAYDASGKVVAYVVTGTAIGYNTEVPIEIESTISADGTILASIDVLQQEETEYLGVRIKEDAFKNQFAARLLPVVPLKSDETGSPIDLISGSTISSNAVLEAVNNAQAFVAENYAPADTAAQ